MKAARLDRAVPPRPLADTVRREDDTVRSLLDPGPGAETMAAFLRRQVRRFRDRPVYAEKKNDAFLPLPWEDFVCEVYALAAFFREGGVRPGDRVVAISRNRGELLVTEFAVMAMGAVFVPLFAGYPGPQLQERIRHAEPRALVVAEGELLRRIEVPRETAVLLTFQPLPAAQVRGRLLGEGTRHASYAAARRAHLPPHSDDAGLQAFLAAGAERSPQEWCLMMYTSGTTGRLKGVMLTHENILSQQRALALIRRLGPEDRFLSYLPWHHSFGGLFEKYSALWNGALLAIDESYGKDFPLLVRNWKAVRPTVYFSVPKIYQDLVRYVEARPEEEGGIFHEEIKFVFTAAAPLPEPVSRFFARRGIPVMEGWGLTETAPCCTVTDLREPREVPGRVGYPIPGVALRITPEGEILVRGPNVMRGYYRNSEATREALPGDGWFHTGDLGCLDGKALRLLARKDRIFKLLNAEKVNPTPLEQSLVNANPYIRHAIVCGSGEEFLAVLLFPDYARIRANFGADRERAEEAVKASLRETVLRLNRENPVKYEHLQAFAVVSRELSMEENELTPSLKVCVRNVLARSAGYVEAIYHPSADCDCRFLKRILRLQPDPRRCFRGKELTLDRCHTCGPFLFPEEETPEEKGKTP